MVEDPELLKAYTREGSEEAFAELVRRYLNLVHSAALRQTRDAESARDVTQAVFLILARKAGSLPASTLLAGWLYRTARYVSLEAVRSERRRKTREEIMVDLNDINQPTATAADWNEVSPKLDSAMDELSETDRNTLLLRFFEGKSLREVAGRLCINEEAAKKRVARALDRLRQNLARNGYRNSSSVLGAALTAYAVTPAPAAMAGFIPTGIAHGTVMGTSVELLTNGTLKMIMLTKLKVTAVAVVGLMLVTGTVTVGVRQRQVAQEHARLERENLASQAQSSQTGAETGEAFAALARENQELQKQALELYRLRAQVTQLRAQQRRTAAPLPPKIAGLPAELRESAETLRELEYERFVAAGQMALKLNPLSEEERVQYNGEIDLMKNAGLALRIYASDHNDEFPVTLDELMKTDLLTDKMKDQLREGPYEYNLYKSSESKPALPAIWWRQPDDRGIRVLVLNDGSAHLIREPKNLELPGTLAGINQ
jgi:RNA polymerase sigma factor (sigma-70 family)